MTRATRIDARRASPPMFRSAVLDRLTRAHPALPLLVYVPTIAVVGWFAFSDLTIVVRSPASRAATSPGR